MIPPELTKILPATPRFHYGGFSIGILALGSLLTSEFLTPLAVLVVGFIVMIGLVFFCEWAISRRLSHIQRLDEAQLLAIVTKAIAPLVEVADKASMIIDGHDSVIEQHVKQVMEFRGQLTKLQGQFETNLKEMVGRLEKMEKRLNRLKDLGQFNE